MNKPEKNYQKMLEGEIEAALEYEKARGKKPTLLLHACCAPCSSYVLEYLSEFFDITLLFYNPNIYPEEEYPKRARELERFVREAGYAGKVKVVIKDYDHAEFLSAVAGHEEAPEGTSRCRICYALRLREAAKYAASGNFDFFTTTLSISPHKDAGALAEIGGALEGELGVRYLYSDFKKRNGYKRSCELSREYGLYRQNYCGCEFSRS